MAEGFSLFGRQRRRNIAQGENFGSGHGRKFARARIPPLMQGSVSPLDGLGSSGSDRSLGTQRYAAAWILYSSEY